MNNDTLLRKTLIHCINTEQIKGLPEGITAKAIKKLGLPTNTINLMKEPLKNLTNKDLFLKYHIHKRERFIIEETPKKFWCLSRTSLKNYPVDFLREEP